MTGEYSVSGKNSEDPGDGFSIYSTVETGEDGETYEGNKNILTFPQDDSPFGGAVEVEFDSIGDAQTALDKILSDKNSDKVLGVHIIGHEAGNLVHEVATAMSFGGSAEDIARTCHGHPTLNEAVKEAALAAGTGAIHI